MKTISMSIEETKRKIAEAINNSGLPFSVIEMLLNELVPQVRQLAQEELKNDITKCKEEENNNSKGDTMTEEELEETTNNNLENQ